MRRMIAAILCLLLLPCASSAPEGCAGRADAPAHQAAYDFSGLANLTGENVTLARDGGLGLSRDLLGFDWSSGAVDTTVDVDKVLPDIAVAPSGDYAVVWVETAGGFDSVVLQRFTADGEPNGTETYIGPSSPNPTGPRVDANSKGEFIVTWQTLANASYARIFATVVGADGQKRVDRRVLVDGTYPDGNAACLRPDDGFVLVWRDWRGNSTFGDLYSRSFDANCAPVANETALVLDRGNCWDTTMVRRPTGEMLLAYDITDSIHYTWINQSIHLLRLFPNGTPDGEPVIVATGPPGVQHSYPCLGLAPDGDLLVVWQVGWKIDDHHDYINVTGQWFDSNLTPKGDPFLIGADVYGYQYFPHLAMAPDGAFVVEWSFEDYVNGTNEVYSRRYDPDGSPNGTAKLVGPHSRRLTGSVAVGSGGDFILAWDENSTGKNADMYRGAVRRVEPFRSSGWVETPKLSPDGLALWDGITAVATLPDANANRVAFLFSTDEGASWEAVAANGSLAAAGSKSPLLVRAFLSTSDNSTSPALWSFSVLFTVNKGPVLAPMADMIVGKNALVTLEVVASDGDGDPLSYEWLQTGGSPAELVNETTATPGIVAPAVGNYSFRVSVKDGYTTVYGTVNITARNKPPNAVLSVGKVDPEAGSAVLFNASGSSDPDGRITGYNYSFGDGNYSGWTNSTEVFHTYSIAGSYGAMVLVRDDDGEMSLSPTTVVRAARGNHPPVITSTPDTIVRAGREWSYTLAARDDDGDAVTFALLKGPGGMTLDNASKRLSWKTGATQSGIFQVNVTALDTHGGASEQGFNIAVVAPPSCSFTYPANGALVSGKTTMRGTALSGVWRVLVEYNLDGSGWKAASGTSNWSFTVDASKLGAGRHTVLVRAEPEAEPSDMASLTFNVASSGNDWTWAFVVLVVVLVGAACGLAVWWRARKR
jgi:hypothetical protein